MSNEAKGPSKHTWAVSEALKDLDGIDGIPSDQEFFDEFMFRLSTRLDVAQLPPDPDSHTTDQEQYMEAKSKRFEAKTEGESTAEVERAMKGEASVSVDRIMEGFDASVEAATEAGVDDEEQDWIDIEQVRKEFTTRITSLFNGEG